MERNLRERKFEIPEGLPINMYILPGTTEKDFAFFYSKYRASEEKLFAKLNSTETLRAALKSDSWTVRLKAVELAMQGEFGDLLIEIKETLRKALGDSDYDVRLKAVELAMQGEFGEEFKKEIKSKMNMSSKQKLTTIEHPLYSGKPEQFFKSELKKTGSKTVLIGNIPKSPSSFKGKIIIRVVDLPYFLTWKKAYDSYNTWKEAGFDYVPVEPILAFELQKDLKVRVYCAVLDNSIKQIGLPQDPILESTLEKMGIAHGHLHNGNECVKFEVDSHGDIDYSKRPRQYIIDFDQASS